MHDTSDGSRLRRSLQRIALVPMAVGFLLAASACSTPPAAVSEEPSAAADAVASNAPRSGTETPAPFKDEIGEAAAPSTEPSPSTEPGLIAGGFSSERVKVVPGPKVSQNWAAASSLDDLKRLDEEMYSSNGMSCSDLFELPFVLGGEFALGYTYLSDEAAQEVAADTGDCETLDGAEDIAQFKAVKYATHEELLQWSGKTMDGTAIPDNQEVTCTQTVLADYPEAVGTVMESLYDKTICVINFDVWSIWGSMPNGADLNQRMQELGDMTMAFAQHHDATAGDF